MDPGHRPSKLREKDQVRAISKGLGSSGFWTLVQIRRAVPKLRREGGAFGGLLLNVFASSVQVTIADTACVPAVRRWGRDESE
ncbi:hypothetical protein MLPF_3358 [Mycobacterium lepromatosis]|nr:hypothetical protein MLPF_3358 [Mycobacterium lepromatosis]